MKMFHSVVSSCWAVVGGAAILSGGDNYRVKVVQLSV
jgi:hypothetical protein